MCTGYFWQKNIICLLLSEAGYVPINPDLSKLIMNFAWVLCGWMDRDGFYSSGLLSGSPIEPSESSFEMNFYEFW